MDVFSNKKLLNNIRDAKQTLKLYCDAGKAIITKKGDLRSFGTVWLYLDRIANILSLCIVQKKHKVAYDSSLKTRFIDHKADGMNHVFMPSKRAYFSLMLKKIL